VKAENYVLDLDELERAIHGQQKAYFVVKK